MHLMIFDKCVHLMIVDKCIHLYKCHCNHNIISITPKGSHVSLSTQSSLFLTPDTVNQLCISSVKSFTQEEPICTLFCLATFVQHIVFEVHLCFRCICSFFLCMADWYSLTWIYHTLFIHSPFDGHLGFQSLAIMDKAAMNSCI